MANVILAHRELISEVEGEITLRTRPGALNEELDDMRQRMGEALSTFPKRLLKILKAGLTHLPTLRSIVDDALKQQSKD